MLAQSDAATVTSRTEELRRALGVRLAELRVEHEETVAEMTVAGLADSGDDVADLGTKALIRDQEFALAVTIQGRMHQVEHALERLDQGHYGWCENCTTEIPVARLAAFPSATLCVACKSLTERRA
jgi:DnaK suppressor protein